MAHVYDMDCELGCKLLKAEKDKIEAVKNWLTYAKAQGYISISKGEQLDEILGAEGCPNCGTKPGENCGCAGYEATGGD